MFWVSYSAGNNIRICQTRVLPLIQQIIQQIEPRKICQTGTDASTQKKEEVPEQKKNPKKPTGSKASLHLCKIRPAERLNEG